MNLKNATAFIDWDSARRCAAPDLKQRQELKDYRALLELQRLLARFLEQRWPSTNFRVALRLYHGWFAGRTKTSDRKNIETQLEAHPITARLGPISFVPEVAFSDSLLCGGARGNIFDTLRQADRNRDAKKPRTEQKMVDTALTCDLL